VSLPANLRRSLVLPAVCAPMTMVSGPKLVSEACKSGIMAGLPRHNAASGEEFGSWLAAVRADIDDFAAQNPDARIGPLAVNIVAGRPAGELRADLTVCARYGVDIIISALGNPAELTRVVHDWGGKVFHDVTNLRFAAKAIEARVDGLVCIGSGGGGHCGTLSAVSFIPRVRQMWDGTIIFAGGVSSGAAIRAAEILGADLAYLGTRFIATQESLAPDAYKALLVDCGAHDLIFTERVTGVAANWLKPSLRQAGLDPDALPIPVAARRYEHLPPGARPWRTVWSAGQGIDLINDIPPVAELVQRLRKEYAVACRTPSMYDEAAA
jgi:nitronate monooxygenase